METGSESVDSSPPLLCGEASVMPPGRVCVCVCWFFCQPGLCALITSSFWTSSALMSTYNEYLHNTHTHARTDKHTRVLHSLSAYNDLFNPRVATMCVTGLPHKWSPETFRQLEERFQSTHLSSGSEVTLIGRSVIAWLHSPLPLSNKI